MRPSRKLVGKDVFLGPVRKSDIPRIVKWMNDMDVVMYLTQASRNHTHESVSEFLDRMRTSRTDAYYGIYLNDDTLIGSITLHEIDSINRICNLGLVIGEKEHWNKGYGTQAIKLMLGYAFDILNLNNVMLSLYSFNERALGCYGNVGFKLIGTRRGAKYYSGKYYDEIFMDIKSEDFARKRKR